ncbi:MAG: branched-chain amino acid transaminase [Spirochaetes bacterium]|nr:branched-chain amino acid transaminase [Spirochaetota bacterium]
MAFKAEKIWMDGKLVDWDKAHIHVLSHVVHYGTAAFEGIRVYKVGARSAVFRLQDHVKRLLESCKIYRMDCPYTQAQLETAILDTVRANHLEQAYVRPLIYRGFGELGVLPFKSPVNTAIAAWDWGKYLGEEALEKGVSVCVSSWYRPAPNTLPQLAKMAGNYLNSQLIKMEAVQNGYHEGIALNTDGHVAEGSGENLFLVKNGHLYSPGSHESLLPGITRHSIFCLAEDLGIPVESHTIPRESLYVADELFMSGTAAEITPITQVDKITVADGKRGPLTTRIQEAFFDILQGRVEDRHGWLTFL